MDEYSEPKKGPAPQEGPGPQYQQGPPPQQYQQMPPRRPFMEELTTPDWLAKAVVLGILVMFIGVLIFTTAAYSDDWSTQQDLRTTGSTILQVGVFVILTFFLLAVVHGKELDNKYRIALLAFALVLLIFAWIMPSWF